MACVKSWGDGQRLVIFFFLFLQLAGLGVGLGDDEKLAEWLGGEGGGLFLPGTKICECVGVRRYRV